MKLTAPAAFLELYNQWHRPRDLEARTGRQNSQLPFNVISQKISPALPGFFAYHSSAYLFDCALQRPQKCRSFTDAFDVLNKRWVGIQ